MSCALTGTGGTCSTVPVGPGSAEPVRRPGGDQLRHRRDLRRQRRLPSLLAAAPPARRRAARGVELHAAADLQRRGRLPDARRRSLRRLQLRHERHLPHAPARPTPTASRPTSATPASARRSRSARPARAATECASGLCQQGVCCSSSCTGTCRSCALAGTAGTCTLVAGRRRPAQPVRRQRRRQLRHRRDLRRRRRLPAVRGRHRPAWARPAPASRSRRPARCNGTGTCLAASLVDLQSLRLRTERRLPHDLRGDRPTATRPTPASPAAAARSRSAPPARAAAECNSDVLRAGGLLRHRLRRDLPVVRAGRDGRDLRVGRRPAQDPLNQCADQGASSCGTDGFCDGSGGCRRYAQRDHLRAVDLQRDHVHARPAPATAPAPAAPRRATNCGAYVCGASGSCLIDLRDRRRLRRAQRLQRRQLRQEAQRRHLRGRGRVRERLLRAGGLLPDRLHRQLPIVRARRHGRDLHAGRRRRRSAGPVRGQRRCRAAAPTAPATAAAPAGCTPAARPASAASCTGSTFTPPRTCNGTGTCQTTTAQSCGAYACGANACKTSLHGRRRLRGAQRLRQRRLPQEADRHRLRRRGRVRVRLLRAGDLLRDRLHRDLPVVRAGGHAGHLQQRARRTRSAEPVHRPGRVHLRHRRLLQRRRRLPRLRARGTHARRRPARARR